MNKKIVKTILITTMLIFLFTVPAFAASNPIVNASNWFMTGIQSVFVVGVAIIGLVILFKRKIVTGITFLLIAGIAALFVYGGSDVFTKISRIISSWF